MILTHPFCMRKAIGFLRHINHPPRSGILWRPEQSPLSSERVVMGAGCFLNKKQLKRFVTSAGRSHRVGFDSRQTLLLPDRNPLNGRTRTMNMTILANTISRDLYRNVFHLKHLLPISYSKN